ncbi:MAG: hypothetical protein KatS3mg031_2888 [Chitinophagales bacterium]|nr:MAG: hypothetical protein KatS3mg031_2888 [Chitinophagales bacterium]
MSEVGYAFERVRWIDRRSYIFKEYVRRGGPLGYVSKFLVGEMRYTRLPFIAWCGAEYAVLEVKDKEGNLYKGEECAKVPVNEIATMQIARLKRVKFPFTLK